MKKTMKRLMIVAVAAVLMLGVLSGCGKKDTVINIASQNVNEVVILANMAKLLIEDSTDYEVTINTEFTGSSVLHQAMVNKEIDIYPTWTGTQLTGILAYEGENLSTEDAYEYVKSGFEEQFNMTWSEPFGFNDTYILTVTQETAETYNLEKSSDLAPYAADWTLAGDDNFDVRPDGYPGWSEAYGIEFGTVLPMTYGMAYRALDAGEAEVGIAYSTDSNIVTRNLVTLEDDLGYFPDYSGAYVLSEKIVNDYPDVIDIVNQLGGMLDNDQMVALNYLFDNGENPETIARDFLVEQGFIEE